MDINKFSDNIIIFGTGSSEFSFTRSFQEIDPLFYVDNDSDKEFTIHRNRIILPPKIIPKITDGNFKIIIASEFYDEISAQLKTYGLKEKRDYVSHVDLLFEASDFFLVSYMKCGRTWLRFMIARLIENIYSLTEEDLLFYTDTYLKYTEKVPVITSLHDDNPHLKSVNELTLDKSQYQKKKVLFMVRDPRDVVVSLFYHMKYRAKTYDGSLKNFVHNKIGTIVKYYNIWYSKKNVPDNFHMLRYEDLHKAPVATFGKVAEFLGIRANRSQLAEAVEQSSFKNMKKYEAGNEQENTQLKPEDEDDERSYKVRKGKAGGFEEELDDELIEEVNKNFMSKLNPDFGYTND